jgi:hypothetical protein
MTIENRELYRLYGNIKHYDKAIYYGTCGLFIEGFNGGVTAYATDGKAIYRKTFLGDNKEAFISYFSDWQKKDGITDAKNLKSANGDFRKDIMPKIKEYFGNERFNAITVNAKEFKQAIKAVDAINKGERDHGIILSFHNGEFNLASWNGIDNGDTAFWQIDGVYSGYGAVKIDRKYFDGIKSEKKPPDKDGLFWKILAVIGVAASIASLILTIIGMAR